MASIRSLHLKLPISFVCNKNTAISICIARVSLSALKRGSLNEAQLWLLFFKGGCHLGMPSRDLCVHFYAHCSSYTLNIIMLDIYTLNVIKLYLKSYMKCIRRQLNFISIDYFSAICFAFKSFFKSGNNNN